MKRILLIVSYDGTEYHGFQVQPEAETIEGVLNRSLSELLQEEIVVIGASRTDSGVHAEGNIAIFDTESRIPPEKIAPALNQRLPEDVVIQQSMEVLPDFHPRRVPCRKTYEYRIYNYFVPNPLVRRYSYFYYRPLDAQAMREAAAFVPGTRDFSSFCSAGTQVLDKVRTVQEVSVTQEGRIITIRITGNGFLYNMVRILAGTLIQAGLHNFAPEHMAEILNAADRSQAGPTAPAMGLTLKEIRYQNEISINHFENDF